MGKVMIFNDRKYKIDQLVGSWAKSIEGDGLKQIRTKDISKLKDKSVDNLILINVLNTSTNPKKTLSKFSKKIKSNGSMSIYSSCISDASKNVHWVNIMPNAIEYLLSPMFAKIKSSQYFGDFQTGIKFFQNCQYSINNDSHDQRFIIASMYKVSNPIVANYKKINYKNITPKDPQYSINFQEFLPAKIKDYLFNLRGSINRVAMPAHDYLIKGTTRPLSYKYGFDRGTPIDRYYIEKFLDSKRKYVQGKCLEIVDTKYIDKYGNNVIQKDALDIYKTKNTTILDDLRSLKSIPDNSYDCLIITQTLNINDDIDSAIKNSKRILKKGGVLLATVPVVGPNHNPEFSHWRLNQKSAQYIFGSYFDKVKCEEVGDQLSRIGFWAGMSTEDLLDIRERNKSKKLVNKNGLLVTIMAKK